MKKCTSHRYKKITLQSFTKHLANFPKSQNQSSFLLFRFIRAITDMSKGYAIRGDSSSAPVQLYMFFTMVVSSLLSAVFLLLQGIKKTYLGIQRSKFSAYLPSSEMFFLKLKL